MPMNDRYERVITAANNGVPDRVPWSVWAHYPAIPWLKHYSWELANRNGEHQAKAHLALLQALDYKMDLLKVTPFFRAMADRWGSDFEFKNNDGKDTQRAMIVNEPEDWERLWVLDPWKDLRENLRCIQVLADTPHGTPFIYSISSPVTQALHGVSDPETFHKHLREHTDAVLKGLETINETNKEFMKAAVDEGCHGFFYGIAGRGGYWSRFTRKQLEDITLRLDKEALNSVDSEIQMLHICNTLDENPEKDGGLVTGGWFNEYPVNILNWWDHHFVPVGEAKKVYEGKKCIAGGLDHKKTLMDTPEAIMAEAKQAIKDAGEDGGFILAGGCTVSHEAPLANYNAVGKAVQLYGKYKK
ncbi:hypothetical protein GF326_03465 [Candidatus Bathyarchaeota archaeon]|nr:hypothetical protein [Candidatus Bathyarchaeota archaeon]